MEVPVLVKNLKRIWSLFIDYCTVAFSKTIRRTSNIDIYNRKRKRLLALDNKNVPSQFLDTMPSKKSNKGKKSDKADLNNKKADSDEAFEKLLQDATLRSSNSPDTPKKVSLKCEFVLLPGNQTIRTKTRSH